MKELYLHIGPPKTGSSALQVFFCDNYYVLKKKGILYPKTGRARLGGHHHFINAITYNQHPGFPPEKSFEEYIEDLIEECKGYPIVLLSSEFMYLDINIARLLSFKEIFSNIIIITYIRRQDEHLKSLYSELTKVLNSSVLSLQEYVKHYANLKWFQTLQQYGDLFGKENIIVRPYEKQQFRGGTIFSDFLSIFSLDLEDYYILPHGKINQSPLSDDLEYKRMINMLILGRIETKLFIKPLDMHSQSKRGVRKDIIQNLDLWSPQERLNVIEGFADTNATIAREYLGRSDGRLFCDPLPNPEEYLGPYPGLSEDKVLEITRYIAEYSPHIISILKDGILKGLISDDNKVREAAEILSPALSELNKKNAYKILILNMLQDILHFIHNKQYSLIRVLEIMRKRLKFKLHRIWN